MCSSPGIGCLSNSEVFLISFLRIDPQQPNHRILAPISRTESFKVFLNTSLSSRESPSSASDKTFSDFSVTVIQIIKLTHNMSDKKPRPKREPLRADQWECCQCFDYWTWVTTPSCQRPTCQHIRCENCKAGSSALKQSEFSLDGLESPYRHTQRRV